MTDKKFTDDEIIKALECCIKMEDCLKSKCPFSKEWGLCLGNEPQKLYLDLINRQKSEIDSAKSKIEICAEVIERQDKEIERLKECPKCVYEYDGEVAEYCVQGPCSNLKTVEQIKAEAYKEFAERLEDYAEECINSGYDGIGKQDIDNLLKEMVGEEE